MKISFTLIGSNELHDQIVKDIDSLIEGAYKRNLIPLLLTVGNVFMDVAVAQSICATKSIIWENTFSKNKKRLSRFFDKKKKQLYNSILKSNGKVGHDESRNLDIFFDPDEPYLSLRCVDKNTKAKDNEPSTKQGYAILVVKFKADEIDEILSDFTFKS